MDRVPKHVIYPSLRHTGSNYSQPTPEVLRHIRRSVAGAAEEIARARDAYA